MNLPAVQSVFLIATRSTVVADPVATCSRWQYNIIATHNVDITLNTASVTDTAPHEITIVPSVAPVQGRHMTSGGLLLFHSGISQLKTAQPQPIACTRKDHQSVNYAHPTMLCAC